jgi:hypothetical protein
MAKRKAVRGSSRKRTAKVKTSSRTRAAAKKTAASRKIARKAAKKTARKATKTARVTKKAVVRRAKPAARPRVAKKKASMARKGVAVKKKVTVKAKTKPVKKAAAARPSSTAATPKRTAAKDLRQVARTAPGLNRERRTISDDIVPSPPSSLDLDRSASAARSGRREMLEKLTEHTETSPALTAGDVDADWESAYSVGDEAPGGDNPTPDQDIVDDIGRAVGVEYQDNEELKGEKKIIERDKHRWELDPASSDDWEDR